MLSFLLEEDLTRPKPPVQATSTQNIGNHAISSAEWSQRVPQLSQAPQVEPPSSIIHAHMTSPQQVLLGAHQASWTGGKNTYTSNFNGQTLSNQSMQHKRGEAEIVQTQHMPTSVGDQQNKERRLPSTPSNCSIQTTSSTQDDGDSKTDMNIVILESEDSEEEEKFSVQLNSKKIPANGKRTENEYFDKHSSNDNEDKTCIQRIVMNNTTPKEDTSLSENFVVGNGNTTDLGNVPIQYGMELTNETFSSDAPLTHRSIGEFSTASLQVPTRGIAFLDNNTSYTCPVCSEIFTDKNMYCRHSQLVHRIELHPCGMCYRIFNSKDERLAHTKAEHPHNWCDTCSKSFSTYRYLQDHINSCHSRERVFKCEHCNSEHYSRQSLHNHMKRKHNRPSRKRSAGQDFSDPLNFNAPSTYN